MRCHAPPAYVIRKTEVMRSVSSSGRRCGHLGDVIEGVERLYRTAFRENAVCVVRMTSNPRALFNASQEISLGDPPRDVLRSGDLLRL